MNTIILHHQGRVVALACATRVWFAAHIDRLPFDHPRKRLVAYMTFYARDVLTGSLPGPYTDEAAERFARLALIDPTLLARDRRTSDARLAELLCIPLEQLQTLLAVDAPDQLPRPRACGRRRRRLSPTTPQR
jgi:hypothetical protein